MHIVCFYNIMAYRLLTTFVVELVFIVFRVMLQYILCESSQFSYASLSIDWFHAYSMAFYVC